MNNKITLKELKTDGYAFSLNQLRDVFYLYKKRLNPSYVWDENVIELIVYKAFMYEFNNNCTLFPNNNNGMFDELTSDKYMNDGVIKELQYAMSSITMDLIQLVVSNVPFDELKITKMNGYNVLITKGVKAKDISNEDEY